jgi:thiamine-monophosphate kinase
MTHADQQDEFGIIAQYFAPLAHGQGETFSLTDDAALLEVPPGQQLVMTKDMMVAGVHFFADDAPDLIARKLLRVNVSDLAAMGAKPLAYMLGFGPVAGVTADWIKQFADGLAVDQREFGMTLLGGDSIASPRDMAFSLTAYGLVPSGEALTRAGAQPGDGVYVSGTIGDGALGLAARQSDLSDPDGYLTGRYHLPQPRYALGQALRGFASAALDVSDGLASDAGHMAMASGISLSISAHDVPLSKAARDVLDADASRQETILTGGDDYELLFAVPGEREDHVARIAADLDIQLTRIGVCGEGQGIQILGPEGKPLSFGQSGYNHFA